MYHICFKSFDREFYESNEIILTKSTTFNNLINLEYKETTKATVVICLLVLVLVFFLKNSVHNFCYKHILICLGVQVTDTTGSCNSRAGRSRTEDDVSNNDWLKGRMSEIMGKIRASPDRNWSREVGTTNFSFVCDIIRSQSCQTEKFDCRKINPVIMVIILFHAIFLGYYIFFHNCQLVLYFFPLFIVIFIILVQHA